MSIASVALLILTLLAVFMAIVLHEVAHGYAAYVLGDDTAKRVGRLSLNPLQHVDVFGTVILPLLLFFSGSGFLFGWAKPVPVNFYNLRRWPRDMLIVSGAGIAVNLALAIAAHLLLKFATFLPDPLLTFLFYFGMSNLVLAFFNLLPIPPLDGSKLFFGWIRQPWAQKYVSSDRNGLMILIFLIVLLPMILNHLNFDAVDPLRWYLQQCFSLFSTLMGG